MKDTIIALLDEALATLKQQGIVPADASPAYKVDPAKDKAHGDYASNLAMTLAKPAGKLPRDVAQALIEALPASDAVRKVEIAGPGFLNFFAATDAVAQVVAAVEAVLVDRVGHHAREHQKPVLAKVDHILIVERGRTVIGFPVQLDQMGASAARMPRSKR